ncbi:MULTISPECIES: hypothetical protein [unclassified Tolypothrix]|uniref:hypothetical protein n=1 Tax=unclassified Tolypothrix TaxID=2649714 RepID=UPI0005EABAF5|nr:MULTISPECIES: hypothetical protein [unclassified Tolypothrix]BAY88426.1 hypothetical protein NIES3275_04010 [Microchaete diplosiphon NIES-3275]EKF02200.1 hypothetical protein FDUTEX481_06924 [Tolypothrix sp. PCC 7601]MBE9081159.1 hypothetical protein [Tolypothrix sp. LEGE 11397]UYD29108.1 hypothetical protein HGR01_14345 [Tolypothrix sp. PCC 7712]UYD34979.1 hypothetical protein HG267_03995 [Tolypothrix sp. PCC 7601]
MINESMIKLTISWINPDDEKLEDETVYLLDEMKQVDEFETVGRVQVPLEDIPDKAKPLGNFLPGFLMAEVSPKNIKGALGYLHSRLSGKEIEFEVEANGKKLKVKAKNYSQQELLDVVKAAEEVIKSN